jgi:peroxiredoxin
MKCRLALDSIARRYVPGSIRRGYQTHWVTAFHTRSNPPSDGAAPPLAGSPRWKIVSSQTDRPEHDMTPLSPANAERLRQAFQRCRDMEGSLGNRLQAYAAAGREFFPAYSEAVDRLVARIHENGGGENAPRPGEVMPPFMLPDETGRLVSLTSLIGNGPVIVMFYRGHWCPYCRLNVMAIMQAQDEISALGGQIVAIMPETQKYAERFKSEAGAPFPVLTDLDNGYALSLNLAIWLGTEVQQLLSYLDLSDFHGNDGCMLPIPATFVVGRDGLVKARFVDPDFRKRMEIDELLVAVRTASEDR